MSYPSALEIDAVEPYDAAVLVTLLPTFAAVEAPMYRFAGPVRRSFRMHIAETMAVMETVNQ